MADLYTITLLSGAVLTYTNFDAPITWNSNIYAANSLMVSGLKYKCEVGLNVDQQQITIVATPAMMIGGIPFMQAVINGLLDGAEIQRERCFLNSISAADLVNPVGAVILFKGRVGAVDKVGRTTAETTVNSDLVLLDMQMPRNLYSPNCQHILFNSGCTLSKASYSAAGTAGAGSTRSVINWSSASAAYAQGVIAFTSGPNTGARANIKSATSSQLVLTYPLLNAPTIGDVFTATQGCDHTQATCTTKFNNLPNFRGFPYIPPPDYSY